MKKRTTYVTAAAVLTTIAAAAALAGPFDFIKGVAPKVPGGSSAAKYIDAGTKVFEAAGVDTAEGRDNLGQTVALAATNQYKGLDDRDSLQAYVTLVGLTIAHVADPAESHGRYVFGVLNSDDPTACSGPGGYVMITRGAINMCADESELAGVLAHEIGHVAKNHGINAVRQAKLTDAAISAGSAADNHFAAFNTVSDNLINKVLTSGYDQGQENEADKLAVQYLAKAGYDPQGYVRFLKKLDQAKASGGTAFSTHPATAERVRRVEGIAKAGGVTAADRFHKYVNPG